MGIRGDLKSVDLALRPLRCGTKSPIAVIGADVEGCAEAGQPKLFNQLALPIVLKDCPFVRVGTFNELGNAVQRSKRQYLAMVSDGLAYREFDSTKHVDIARWR